MPVFGDQSLVSQWSQEQVNQFCDALKELRELRSGTLTVVYMRGVPRFFVVGAFEEFEKPEGGTA